MKEFIEIKNKIEESESIILTAHINPDGDAVGSSLALFLSLKESYRKKLNIETKIMIKVLEPLSILIISIIIAIIVIAMMLPVFQLGDSLL